jgi:hypothetical protein
MGRQDGAAAAPVRCALLLLQNAVHSGGEKGEPKSVSGGRTVRRLREQLAGRHGDLAGAFRAMDSDADGVSPRTLPGRLKSRHRLCSTMQGRPGAGGGPATVTATATATRDGSAFARRLCIRAHPVARPAAGEVGGQGAEEVLGACHRVPARARLS